MVENSASVLVLAPREGDVETAAHILVAQGCTVRDCRTLDDLMDGIGEADCGVLAQECLVAPERGALAAWIAAQPPWSDFPFVLLTRRGTPPDQDLAEALGNVSLLERPYHPAMLANAVRLSARARRRQREAEQYLVERQQTAERQSLLIRELHHRVKNTLATVQALLGASARSATGVNEFYTSFSARIVSLAKTHNLLTEDYWQTAALGEMLRNELVPYNDESGRRVTLTGPPVELTADLAVPTGMALHELTTNAAKHGALSTPKGRVEVIWDVVGEGAERKLRLDWTERDGPTTAEPTRRGFGSTLLQRVLTVQCGAAIEFDFRPSGLHFRMEAPLRGNRLVPHY